MNTILRRILQSSVVQAALALFGARAVAYLLPLVTIPFLARVLGPEDWGMVVFAQAIGLYIIMVIDYSFAISATRAVARNRENPDELARIVSGVLGAKVFLALACIPVLAVLQWTVPVLRDSGIFLWLALLWAIGFALIPMFYFQGVERVPQLLKIDIPLRVLSTGAVFLLVREPADAWIALFSQALGGVLIMLASLAVIYRQIPYVRPDLSTTLQSLREGRQLFASRVSSSLYWMSNPVILGLVAPVQFVGFYAGAERIIKALQTMTEPVTQAMFPHSSNLAQTDQARLRQIVTITTIVMTAGGLLAAGMLYFMAPLVIRILLGPDYEPAVSVFRVLALLLPLTGLSMPLVMQWMIPLGLDRYLMWIAVGAGALHVPMAILLALRFDYVGIASAYMITETCNVLVILAVLHLKGLIPYTLNLPGKSIPGIRQES